MPVKESLTLPTLDLLTRPGIIGHYTHVEVTEVIAFRERGSPPVNVLTLLVAEERDAEPESNTGFLNKDPIRLPSLKGWSFGIFRYVLPISALTGALHGKNTLDTWNLSGNALEIGRLTAQPPFYVPPNSYQELSWNRVLKNNFWSGSYVFEWHDATKHSLTNIFEHPIALQELTAAVRAHVPISLASLSDRMGNIVVQLPSLIALVKMAPLRNGGGLQFEVVWCPNAIARPVRIECARRYDGTIAGVASNPVVDSKIVLPIPDGSGDYEAFLWDETHDVILAATGPSTFISVIKVNMEMIGSEPRVFKAGPDGNETMRRVSVHAPSPFQVGTPITATVGEWTQKRIYRDEVDRLAARRAIVQYKPTIATMAAERQRALDDIRYLIRNYGRGGAYLWDPYLDAADILETLFYSQTSRADLRALTAMRVPGSGTKEEFIKCQRSVFQASESNFQGLRLEFRGRFGSRGWDFHDRFLIFPDTDEGPLAWSLGASVKSVGTKHNILQRVSDGQLIVDAFLELWAVLDQPENLIWKFPT